MKVFLITNEPFPNGMAATNRIKCYGRAVVDSGIDCEVVVFRRTEHFGNVRNSSGSGISDGVQFKYVSGNPVRSKYKLLRFLFDIYDALKTCYYLRANIKAGDILFIYCGKHIKTISRYIDIAHKNKAFCVRDFCEFPYVYEGDDINKSKIVFERQFPKLDGVISISQSLMDVAKQNTTSRCRHIKIPILVDFEKYNLKDEADKSKIPYIFHSGVISNQKDGILGMIEAFGQASQILKTQINFISTGTLEKSALRNEINQIIHKYKIEEHISFIGILPEAAIRTYLEKASLVISNKNSTLQNTYGFSTKLGEYSAAGKPLIITNVGEAMNYYKDKETAIVVPPDDIDELTRAIVWAFEHYEVMKSYSVAARTMCAENFDFRNWGKVLKEFFFQIQDS